MRRLPAMIATATLYLMACAGGIRIRIDESSTTTVPQGSLLEDLIGDIGFGEFINMDITAAEELANQGVEPGDIEDVFMTLLELEVLSPGDGDLSFIEGMEVYVEAPGVDRALLAWQDTFPEGQKLVPMNLEELDLTPYVVSESMSIVTEVTGRRPEDDTEVEARFELELLAKPAAACDSKDDEPVEE